MTTGSKNDLKQLEACGWSAFDSSLEEIDDLQERALSMATKLGRPIPSRRGGDLTDVLRPVWAAEAKPRSLSRLYAKGAFPLHTDMAHYPRPCRYLIFACVNPGDGNRPTNLLDSRMLDFSDADKKSLITSPFVIKNGRRSFFSTILSDDGSHLRFDEGCMKPATANGRSAMDLFAPQRVAQWVTPFYWKPGIILILDNWRMLHGRGAGVPTELDSLRTLLRISIL